MYEQSHICIDDYGDAVYNCIYTNKPVFVDAVIVVGARIPGVKARLFMSPTKEAKRLRTEEGVLFHESEANCNTCLYLERVKHKKDSAGFLYGRCTNKNGNSQKNPYSDRTSGDLMMFHPDDPMHMPCYLNRGRKNENS